MKIKNTTAEDKVWTGQTIAAGAYYTIPQAELYRWQNDSTVLTDLASGDLLLNDDVNDISDVATAINYLLQKDTEPRDVDGSRILRPKVCKIGWHFQVHGVEFKTSQLDSLFNKSINPTTLALADLGFASLKCYKGDGTEITDQAVADTDAEFTVIDWMVNHEMEILGGILNQNSQPNSDIRVWVIGAPGIANVPFGQGGLNLKLTGPGRAINADGKASKYLHPTIPMAGVNKMRIILKHGAGVKHQAQFLFELFKP